MGGDSPHRRRTSHAGSEPHTRGIKREWRDRSGLFLALLGSWFFRVLLRFLVGCSLLSSVLVLGWWLFGRWLVVLRGNRRSGLGRIGASSHQRVFRSARGSAGAREADRGSRWLDSARPRWCPVRTARRPHEVDRSEAESGLQLVLSIRAGGLNRDHFWSDSLGVCVCVFVAPV